MKMENKKNNIVNIYTHWWFSGTSEVAQDKEKVKNVTLLRKKIISKVFPVKNFQCKKAFELYILFLNGISSFLGIVIKHFNCFQ